MKPLPKPNAYSIRVRVYYEDTDAGGVVYYANYLKFLERCRTEWLRSIGHQQVELLRDPGVAFVVRSVRIDFHKPARLDDELVVGLEVVKIGRAQVFFRQHIRRAERTAGGADDELVSSDVHVACVNTSQMKATAIPAELRTRMEALQ